MVNKGTGFPEPFNPAEGRPPVPVSTPPLPPKSAEEWWNRQQDLKYIDKLRANQQKKRQINNRRNRSQDHTHYYPTGQWDPNDFKVLAAELVKSDKEKNTALARAARAKLHNRRKR